MRGRDRAQGEQHVGSVRFPSVERFVLSYVHGSPLAGIVAQANIAAREKLTADIKHALGEYTTNEDFSFPIAAHLLAATA